MNTRAFGIEILASLLFLVAFLQLGSTQFLDWECGLRYYQVRQEDRIIKGKNANMTSSPWMAYIITTDDYFICGGTLITNRSYKYICRSVLITRSCGKFPVAMCRSFVRLVLTAAHCYHQYRHLKVVLGEYNTERKERCHDTVNDDVYCTVRKEIDVEFGVMHPQFNRGNTANDIAILRLAEEVEYTENIRPICIVLDKTWRDYIDGMKKLVVTGWGYTAANGKPSGILQTLVIERQSPEYCAWNINRAPFYNEFCLGNEDSSVCNGDSGGPVGKLIRWGGWPRFIQVGIASLTNHQCSKASLYADVLSHVDWILEMNDMYGYDNILPPWYSTRRHETRLPPRNGNNRASQQYAKKGRRQRQK